MGYCHMNHVYPTEIQLLLVRALVAPDKDFPVLWMQWKDVCGPYADLDDGSLRLFPLAYTRLSQLLPDDNWLQVTENAYRFHWLRNSYLMSEANRVMDLLRDQNIPYVVLKGAAFISNYYNNQTAVRSIDDVDICIPTQHFFDAMRLIQKDENYTSHTNIDYFQPEFFHEVTLYTPKGILDMHCHAFRTYLQDDDWEILQKNANMLSDTDNLVHICAYALQWNASTNLRWIIDAVAVLQKGSIDWERVVYLSGRFRVSVGVHAALSYLQEQKYIEVPVGILRKLGEIPASKTDRALYNIALQDTTANVGAALQLYWWRYVASLRKPFSAVDAIKKLIGFTMFLCQTNNLASIPAIIVMRFWELTVRSWKSSFSV